MYRDVLRGHQVTSEFSLLFFVPKILFIYTVSDVVDMKTYKVVWDIEDSESIFSKLKVAIANLF